MYYILFIRKSQEGFTVKKNTPEALLVFFMPIENRLFRRWLSDTIWVLKLIYTETNPRIGILTKRFFRLAQW